MILDYNEDDDPIERELLVATSRVKETQAQPAEDGSDEDTLDESEVENISLEELEKEHKTVSTLSSICECIHHQLEHHPPLLVYQN